MNRLIMLSEPDHVFAPIDVHAHDVPATILEAVEQRAREFGVTMVRHPPWCACSLGHGLLRASASVARYLNEHLAALRRHFQESRWPAGDG